MEDPIERFFRATKELEGTVDNRGKWNSGVNADQAKHFLNGVSDLNDRWDPDADGTEVHPGYLSSVVYPLHLGAEIDVPLVALIGEVEYEWDDSVHVDDSLDGKTEITDVYKKGNPDDGRYVFVDSEVRYRRSGEEIARAHGTMVRAAREQQSVPDREVYEYTEPERDEIRATLDAEIERMDGPTETPSIAEVSEGETLPTLARGPLTIADMVCWNAARGPTYGAGIQNYIERGKEPYYTMSHPKTGWPQKESHQHEDPWLSTQRGMPLPFANGVMMLLWTTPLVTNWMGEDGFLRSHRGRFHSPYFYSDVLWLNGEITEVDADESVVLIEWEATNQHDEQVMSGRSEVEIAA